MLIDLICLWMLKIIAPDGLQKFYFCIYYVKIIQHSLKEKSRLLCLKEEKQQHSLQTWLLCLI